MHVSQSVLVLVFVEQLLTLTITVRLGQVHITDLLLQFIVESLQVMVLVGLVMDCLNKLTLHLRGGGQVSDTVLIVFTFAHFFVIKVFAAVSFPSGVVLA